MRLVIMLMLVVAGCEDGGAADATPPPTPDAASIDAQEPCDGPEDCGGSGRVCCMIQTSSCVAAGACDGIELCHDGGDCASGVCCPQGFFGPGCD